MKTKLLFILLCTTFLFFSCARTQNEPVQTGSYESFDGASNRTYAMKAVASPTAQIPADAERKLIQTATIRLSTKKILELRTLIEEQVQKEKGFIENTKQLTNEDNTVKSVNMNVRVPSVQLNAFIDFLEKNAKILEKSVQSKDVTETYYDVDERIKNRQILLDKYRSYMTTAKNLQEILEVEDRINSLTYEIEQMKGTLKSLDKSITYASLNLTIVNANMLNNASLYSFSSRFNDFSSHLSAFFAIVFFVLLYIAIFGTILILIVGALYYFSFGKIGLIKKLFKKLS